MKLSTFALLGTVLTAVAAFGDDVTTANTFGVLKIADNTSSNLIISVPWVDCTDASKNVLVSNAVMTTNLKTGDLLIEKAGSTYYGWQLNAKGNWANLASTAGGVSVTADADGRRVARGTALWLIRTDPANSSPVYLFGQYESTSPITTLAAGATTMVGNASDADVKVSALAAKFTSGKAPAAGDKILVNTGRAQGYKSYTYKDGAWKTLEKKAGSAVTIPGVGDLGTYSEEWKAVTDTDVIPAGTGFWYQRVSKAAATAITW